VLPATHNIYRPERSDGGQHHYHGWRFWCYRWPGWGSSVGFGLLWANVGKKLFPRPGFWAAGGKVLIAS
jgi:hypothetical protein